MEQYNIETDIQVMFLEAPKFPDDVPNTFTKLEQAILDKSERRYFGFSRPNRDGVIQYKACAEILNEDEEIKFGLKKMTIDAGQYASIFIKNHFEDGNNIPNAFGSLLKHPQLDPNGFCLEIYKNFTDADVLCLVPIIP